MTIKQDSNNLLCAIFKDIHLISTGDDHIKSVIGDLNPGYEHLKNGDNIAIHFEGLDDEDDLKRAIDKFELKFVYEYGNLQADSLWCIGKTLPSLSEEEIDMGFGLKALNFDLESIVNILSSKI